MRFVCSYITGMVPDLNEYVVPVEAQSKEALVESLRKAISRKADLREQNVALYEERMKLSAKERVNLSNPAVISLIENNKAFCAAEKVCGRYFGALDDLNDVDEIEILTLEEWFGAYEVSDAQEEARRHVESGKALV